MNPIQRILQHFKFGHLPPHLQEVSKPVCDLANDMVSKLPEDPETTVGLRKLLEAKDCFVRAALSRTLALLLALLFLGGCAAPGSTTEIPQSVAIAMAGGDVSTLPAAAWTAPPVKIDLKWYDRTWGLQVDRDAAGAHFVDLTSSANGENALEARRSDNQRAVDITGSIVGALQQGLAVAAQAYAPVLAAQAQRPARPLQADAAAILGTPGLSPEQQIAVLQALLAARAPAPPPPAQEPPAAAPEASAAPRAAPEPVSPPPPPAGAVPPGLGIAPPAAGGGS